jgi:hypothetical protein
MGAGIALINLFVTSRVRIPKSVMGTQPPVAAEGD